MRITIHWITKDYKFIRRTQRYFNLPQYMTVNKETDANVSKEVLEGLKRGQPKYLLIRERNVQSKDTE